MKSNIKIVLFTLAILFLFSIMFKAFSDEEINHIEFNDGKNGIGFYEEIPNQLEQSASWNFTGTILIDNNWTTVNATYDWCTGAGTESEPYIIENVTIEAQGAENGIYVQNSNAYFIIHNCSLYNIEIGSSFVGGIALNNVTNGKIVNNYCYSNFFGIYLYQSNNNMVLGNNVHNNYDDGIFLRLSNDNTVSGNNVSNDQNGIYI